MPSASRLARLWFLVHVWEKVDHHDAESSVNVFLALVETLSRSLERLNIISRLEAMITNAMEYIFHSILSLSLAWSISFEYLCAHYAHRIHFEWVFEFPGFSFLHTRANKQTYLRSRTLNMAKLFFFTREVVCGGIEPSRLVCNVTQLDVSKQSTKADRSSSSSLELSARNQLSLKCGVRDGR
jgi:hypothetical protein